MENSFKNIFNLSKIFIKENQNNFKLINEKNKINKKSILFWIYIILFFGIFYISNEIVDYTVKIGKPEIFLNVFLLFLEVLIIIRTIMMSTNVFYFSKEIENILHLPFKPLEILISKFNTILFMNYEIELIFGLIPLAVYGLSTHMGFLFFINIILILLIFPIFAITIVSIIMIFLMRFIKFFKNKDLMQTIITFILIFGLMFFISKSFNYIFDNLEKIDENNQQIVLNNFNEKIIKINNYFLNINPTSNILLQKNILKILFNYLKLIFINLIGFLIFIYLGNKFYLKQLLKANFYFKNKKNKNIKLNKKLIKNNIGFSYIKKEFKLLFKNPIFFIQSIYPVILMTVVFAILIITLVPTFRETLKGEDFKEYAEQLKFDIEAVCLIIGAIQVVGLFNYTSITSISRDGKNAYIMKYLPIKLNRQIIYKSIPQILINTICTIIILIIINLKIPEIEINYLLIIFLLSVLLNIINSIILVIIDLLMPKLEWDEEYDILKNNKNKLLQYVLIILNILFLIYIKKIFEKIDLNISLIIFGIILIIFLIITNYLIFKFKNKLFKKIN